VQQGDIPWFDHHGFQQARRSTAGGPLQLTLRVNRAADREGTYRFAMLEPVIGELKLTNTSGSPTMVDRSTLRSEHLGILVRREGEPEAGWHLAQQAYGDLDTAADTFGHIRLTREVTRSATGLDSLGRRDSATQLLDGLVQTLEDRHVKREVVQKVRRDRQQIAESRAGV
jgi:hypothetical protein